MESIINKKNYNLSFGIVSMINCCVASPSVCLHFLKKTTYQCADFWQWQITASFSLSCYCHCQMVGKTGHRQHHFPQGTRVMSGRNPSLSNISLHTRKASSASFLNNVKCHLKHQQEAQGHTWATVALNLSKWALYICSIKFKISRQRRVLHHTNLSL